MEQEYTGFILLNIGYAIHQGDWNYKHVNSPFARIYLVKEGTAKLHLPDKVQVFLRLHCTVMNATDIILCIISTFMNRRTPSGVS